MTTGTEKAVDMISEHLRSTTKETRAPKVKIFGYFSYKTQMFISVLTSLFSVKWL